jgi:protein required for attachment to host cells
MGRSKPTCSYRALTRPYERENRNKGDCPTRKTEKRRREERREERRKREVKNKQQHGRESPSERVRKESVAKTIRSPLAHFLLGEFVVSLNTNPNDVAGLTAAGPPATLFDNSPRLTGVFPPC